MAIVLGVASLLGAVLIATVAYRRSFQARETQYRQLYLEQARMLGRIANFHMYRTDQQTLAAVEKVWHDFGHRPPDEYLCVIDEKAFFLLHTAHPDLVGHYVGGRLVLSDETHSPHSLRELVAAQRSFVGCYTADSGGPQLATFSAVPRRGWLVGVHRSLAAVRDEVRGQALPLVLGFLLVCGLLTPGSLLLLHHAHRRSQHRSRKAEQALRVSEARFRRLVEHAVDAFYLHDLEGRFVDVNRHGHERLGYSREELLKLSVWDVSQTVNREGITAIWHRLIETGDVPPAFEGIHTRKNGTTFPVEIRLGFLQAEGKPLLLALARDITERKRAEALREGHHQVLEQLATGRGLKEVLSTLIQILENQTDAMVGSVLLLDRDGKQLTLGAAPNLPDEYNRTIDGITVGPTAGACGRAAWIHHKVIVEDTQTSPLCSGFRESLMKYNLRACCSQPIMSSTGQVLGVFAMYYRQSRKPTEAEQTLLDNAVHLAGIAIEQRQAEAERKRLEEQLHHSQKMKAIGQLAAGVAHDFNNLLVGVLGNAEVMLSEMQDTLPAPFRQALLDIRESGWRAATLTRQLLAFSKSRTHYTASLDLNVVLDNMDRFLRRLISDDIRLEINRIHGIGLVLGDVAEMEQVVMNLSLNAAQAMPQGGKLTLETDHVTVAQGDTSHHPDLRPGAYVRLVVRDTGCGMSRETVDRIFEPFYTTKPTGQGTGLGLSTVYGIVKKLGGYIAVDSKPGQGSCFCVYFPRVHATVATPCPTHELDEGEGPGGDETILICEDDEIVRRLMERVLSGHGYTVLSAGKGDQALEVASTHSGDITLLITDVVMQGLNGRELAEKLRKQRPRIATIFMSGYADAVLESDDKVGASVHLLEKPFSSGFALKIIRRVLDQAKRETMTGLPSG